MSQPRIRGRKATCKSCGEPHDVLGTPGQTVTASFTCSCGQQIELTTTFPKES